MWFQINQITPIQNSSQSIQLGSNRNVDKISYLILATKWGYLMDVLWLLQSLAVNWIVNQHCIHNVGKLLSMFRRSGVARSSVACNPVARSSTAYVASIYRFCSGFRNYFVVSKYFEASKFDFMIQNYFIFIFFMFFMSILLIL